MVSLVKMILPAQFFQLLVQSQDLLVLGQSKTNSSFKSLVFVGQQLASFFLVRTQILHFFHIVNVLILNMYRLSYVYDLLLNQDLSDWVKATSRTWYV
jgi:hypothetical protein